LRRITQRLVSGGGRLSNDAMGPTTSIQSVGGELRECASVFTVKSVRF
jgi:hypothetical protein